jgi:hypothetical protein
MRETQLYQLRITASSVLLLFTATSCASPLKQRDPERGSERDSLYVARSEAVANASVPAGHAMGIVVNANNGAPLSSVALQIFKNDSVVHGLRVITDENGFFKLQGIPKGVVKLRATLVGYKRQELAFIGDSGIVVRVGLYTQPVRVCGLQVPADGHTTIPAVSVIVRDARTGAAPTTGVALRIRDHEFVDSASTVAPNQIPSDSVELGAAPYRKGVYEVDVTAPNYQSFHLPKVRATNDSCDHFQGQRLNVWLLPKS